MTDKSVASFKYKCHCCGGDSCKLWRPLSQFGDVILTCWECLESRGHTIDLGQSDQVYDKDIEPTCYGPAVPDLDGSFWGYTSVPKWWVAWWKALPDKPSQCTVCCGSGMIGKYDCVYCDGSGMRDSESALTSPES